MAPNTFHAAKDSRKLLLAYGNPMRSDDGVGWKIAEALERETANADVQIVTAQQLTPELAESIRDADLVLFVDASATTTAGEVTVLEVAPAEEMPRIFTHHLPPASLLAFTRDLYGKLPKRAIAVTVGGASFELGETLTDAVREAIPRALAALREILAKAD